ncbi:uncharacterized protein LOC131224297 [Magnolia sinica]|uniref:uncharacterized protein LOC131224297 n=1 Tax=Magnolia sinica TaxID=86752 RepID=UPI00265985FE|nr:uncharacterized protein LOC131224297 [Magnolia sinica]
MEFETLVQGDMSMSQYEARFLALSRFAPFLTDDEKRRACRFYNGLRSTLRSQVVGHCLETFDQVIHRALVYEDWTMTQRTRDQSFGRQWKRRAPADSSRQHRQQRQGIGGMIGLFPYSSRGHRNYLLPILLSSSIISSERSIRLPLLGLLLSNRGSQAGLHSSNSNSKDSSSRGDMHLPSL